METSQDELLVVATALTSYQGFKSRTSLFNSTENVGVTHEFQTKEYILPVSKIHGLRSRHNVHMPQALFKQNIYYLWKRAVKYTVPHNMSAM